jgi:hypothetical protein
MSSCPLSTNEYEKSSLCHKLFDLPKDSKGLFGSYPNLHTKFLANCDDHRKHGEQKNHTCGMFWQENEYDVWDMMLRKCGML